MKTWDIIDLLKYHEEGVSSPQISRLIAVKQGIIGHIKDEVDDIQKKQVLSLNKQAYTILRQLETRHLVKSFKIGDGAIYFELIRNPVDERYNFKCPKCETVRRGNMGSLLLCANPECMRKDDRHRLRFWANRKRMLL